MNNQKKVKVLYVEDDESLSFVTMDNLVKKGYDVTLCRDGLIAMQEFLKKKFDICILDVMLPKVDGFALAQKIRDKDSHIPIIFLTAKSMMEDKMTGFKIGADDYITKPFSMEELLYKLEIFIKRSKVYTETVEVKTTFYIRNFEFDFKELKLKYKDNVHDLTLREAELLRMFCLNKNQVVKRDDILKQIWGEDDYYIGRSLDVFISRLRKYFQVDDKVTIENIRSVGFKLNIED